MLCLFPPSPLPPHGSGLPAACLTRSKGARLLGGKEVSDYEKMGSGGDEGTLSDELHCGFGRTVGRMGHVDLGAVEGSR